MLSVFQNPNGVSRVRISAQSVPGSRGTDSRALLSEESGRIINERTELISTVEFLGMEIRIGTLDDRIRLSGTSGVQTHIRKSDAYVFSGKPSLGELLKLASLFVGLQTLDPDLHYTKDGKHYRRPVIIYGDPKDYKPLFDMILHLHKEAKTVRQDPYGLIRFAHDPEEFKIVLPQEIEAEDSVHGDGASKEEVEAALQLYSEQTEFPCLEMPEKSSFSLVVFTSASKETPEGFDLGAFLAKNGIGCVTGAGKTGNMGAVAKGVQSEGGHSFGANCPHIAAQEGLPEWMNIVIKPCIYTRMEAMFAQADGVLIGGGGIGGMGTLQELLAALVLVQERSPLMTVGKNGSARPKPIIVDNSKNTWVGLEKLLEPFGIIAGKHYMIANTEQEVQNNILKARKGELKLEMAPNRHALSFLHP